jgi:hypothetical protein
MQVGNLVIGEYWSPAWNFERGSSITFVDEGTHVRTEASDLLTDLGVRYRKLTFNLSTLDADDRVGLIEILRRVGISYPLFVSMYPANIDPSLESLYCLQCTLESVSALTSMYSDKFSLPLSLIEI